MVRRTTRATSLTSREEQPPDEVSFVLHTKQGEFCASNRIYRGFVAGVGSGKTFVGAYDLLTRAKPGALYAIVAPTYKVLSDATMRTFKDVAKSLHLWNEDNYRKTDNQAILNNGVEVLFRSGDNPGNLRGPTLAGTWLDECSQMDEEVFSVMIGRLRHGGKQGWLCLAGEEKLYDPVANQHRRLDEIHENFHVYSVDLTNGRRVVAMANAPFRKGVAPLYRFHLSNGRSFVAPLHHWVLACTGPSGPTDTSQHQENSPPPWRCDPAASPNPETSNAGVANRTWLPLGKCVANLPPCVAQEHPTGDRACGQYCSGTVLDFQSDCPAYFHSGDAQPHRPQDAVPDTPPSQVDVQQHSHGDLHSGAQDAATSDTRSTSSGHRSIDHCDSQKPLGTAGRSHASWPPSGPNASHSLADRRSPGESDDPARTTCASVQLANLSDDPLCIVSYEYVRTDWYYDLTVPVYHNYEHCQLIHHNSGTFTPAGKDHWTYRIFGATENPNVTLIHCSTKDNPFIEPAFYENLLDQYGRGEGGRLRAMQELEGLFVCVQGAEWGPELFTPDIWFDEWPTDDRAITVIYLDSSKGIGGKSGDYSSFAIVMYSRGYLWVEFDLDNIRNSSMMAATGVELQKRYHANYFGIESEFGGSVLANDLVSRANQQNVLMPIVLVPTQGVQKEVRIRRITPYLTRRMIRFRSTEQTKLGVQQFESFPHAAHDDAPDSLEGAIRIINESGLV